MTGLNGFVFGGLDSVSSGIIMLQPPPIVIPERDVETISIPGRSGDVLWDNGQYKNIRIPYNCAIFPDDTQTLREAVDAAVMLLHRSGSYERLEDTYNPDYFRQARIYGEISAESIMEQAGKFTLTFDMKPQRFFKSGEYPVTFGEHGSLYNATGRTALPLIRVYGNGAGSVTVGEITVQISSMDQHLVLDCDTQNAYNEMENTVNNWNSKISAPVFPQLHPGENPISWTGGVERLEIIPRWWTL